MKAIILAGGKGTRMLPLTHTKPKVLLPVANKPILQHQIDDLLSLRKDNIMIDEIIIVTHYLEDKIKKFVASEFANRTDIKITFARQEQPLGTGDAVKSAGGVNENFILLNGDEIFDRQTYIDVVRTFEQKSALGVVGGFPVQNPEAYGVLETDADGKLERLVEKPQQPKTNIVNAGIYVFSPQIFDYVAQIQPSPRGEYEFTDAIIRMAEQTQRVFVAKISSWQTVSMLWDLLDVNKTKVEERIEREGAVNIGGSESNVLIGRNVKIKPGVRIEGDVVIGDNAVLGPDCYIRGSTAIGNGCKIGKGVEIKNSIIMKNTNIPHLSYVADSVIGENCNLGGGTMTANLRHDNNGVKVFARGEVVDSGRRKVGAFIGDWTKTGVGTVISPGRILGPFSWTAPKEVVDCNVEPFVLLGSKGKELIKKEKIASATKNSDDVPFLEQLYEQLKNMRYQ